MANDEEERTTGSEGLPETQGVQPLESVFLTQVPSVFSTILRGVSSDPTAANPDEATGNDQQCRFELHGEIARGGMGAVLRGRDTLLGRELAIKVLLESHRDNPDVVQRFFEEAQINGQLQHPGIVPVHEVGELADERPFFAMKLVKGHTLGELLRRRKSPDDDRSRFIGIFEQICQTVAYAHSRGVIHRDLKPSNVMVGAFGEVQVMDWGLAKVLDSEPRVTTSNAPEPTEVIDVRTVRSTGSKIPTASGSQTRVGSVIGTPAFMPPEQAVGDVDHLDYRADVFGLGAILSVILTGKPPYVTDSATDTVRLAARGELGDAFARLDASGAEPELVGLAKRCLAAEPDDRPDDASAVASEVSGYLQSVAQRLRQAELDRLESETKAEEERKRRRVVLALAASIVSLAALGGGGLIYVQKQQTRHAEATAKAAMKETARQLELTNLEAAAKRAAVDAKDRQEVLRQQAVDAKRKVELTLADVYTSRGLQAASEGEPAMASMWFTSAAAQAQSDPERELQNHLRARNWSREAILPIAALEVTSAAEGLHFQPGGSLLLVQQGSIFALWDWRADQLMPWLDGSEFVQAACWNPDGSSLAIALPTGGIEICRVPDGEVLERIEFPGRANLLAYSRDGKHLAIANDVTRIWQADSQQFLPQSWPHPQKVHAMFFNGAGTRLFTADVEHHVRVFAVDEPGRSTPLFDPILHQTERRPSPPALVDEGRGLITITDRSELTLWDSETGKIVRRLSTEPTWGLSHVVAHPHGDRFAVGGYYGPDLWDMSDLDAKPIHLDHVNLVDHIVYSSDGSLMMSASWDASAQLWSADDGRPIGTRLNHQVGAHRVAISDDNTLLASSQDNRLVRIWQRPSDSIFLGSIEHWGERPRISPDGKLATPGLLHETTLNGPITRPAIQVVFTESGEPAGPTIDPPGLCMDSCIGSDSKTVATVSLAQNTGWLCIWNVASGKPTIEPIRLPGRPLSVSARPGETELAVVIDDGRLIVVDATTGKSKFNRETSKASLVLQSTARADYSPDGTRLVQLVADDRIEVLDASNGEPLFAAISPPLDGKTPCRTFAFSADSKMLATGSNGAARVWSLADGSELCKPLKHLVDWSGMCSVCFSPDGKYLLTGNTDRRARVWDWKKGELACPPLKHDDMIYSVAFTPDGKYAITGARGDDCGPHVWELTTGRRLAPTRQDPSGPAGQAARYVTVTPDGRRLIASTGPLDSLSVIDLEVLLEKPAMPVETLRLLAEVSTSQAVDNGDVDALTIDGWHQRWSQLRESKLNYGHWEPIDLIRQRLSIAQKMAELGDRQSAAAHLRGALDSINETDLPPTEHALLRAEIGIEQARLQRMQRNQEAADSLVTETRQEVESILVDQPDHEEAIAALATLIMENVSPGSRDPTSFATQYEALSHLEASAKAKLAAAYWLDGNYEQAIGILSETSPEPISYEPEKLLLLSMAQEATHQSDAAKETYGRGIVLAKESVLSRSLGRLVALAMTEVGKVPRDETGEILRGWELDRAVIPYNEAVLSNPESAKTYWDRGQWYAANGLWGKAAIDLAETIRLNPQDTFSTYQLTALYAFRDDLSAYRQHCDFVMNLWGDSSEVILADRACMACLIHPHAIEDSDRIDTLIAMVKKEADKHRFANWFYRGIGLHAYRHGNFQAAIDACETSRRLNQEQNVAVLNAANHAIEAMAHKQLGNSEQASQSLSAVKNEFDNNLPTPGVTPMPGFWHDWLTAQILLREATD